MSELDQQRRGELGQREVAEVLDEVAWTYDPEANDPSPLVSTERYFRDFPWAGDDED
jgi:hypothetical protein